MLTYKRFDRLKVIESSNLDFVGCIDTRKTTFDYVYLLARGWISWKSAKNSFIATSIMEVEFVTFFEAIVQANWLQLYFRTWTCRHYVQAT